MGGRMGRWVVAECVGGAGELTITAGTLNY